MMARTKTRGNGRGSLFKRGGKGPWLMKWFDHTGKRRSQSTGVTDKRTAERMLEREVTEAEKRRRGLIDPKDDELRKAAAREFDLHVADFESSMTTAHRKAKHIRCTVLYINAIAAAGKWAKITDIRADDVNTFAAEQKTRGQSARTIQAYLTAVKSFTRWLVRTEKLSRDPLVSVVKPNPETGRRRERRMLLPTEWPWLYAAALNGEPVYGCPAARVRCCTPSRFKRAYAPTSCEA